MFFARKPFELSAYFKVYVDLSLIQCEICLLTEMYTSFYKLLDLWHTLLYSLPLLKYSYLQTRLVVMQPLNVQMLSRTKKMACASPPRSLGGGDGVEK